MQRLCIAALLLSAVAAQLDADPKGPDFMPGEHGVPPLGRLRGPLGDQRPNRRPMELSPVFKVDSVTFQSTSAVPLKEGETMFRMVRPRDGEEGPRPEEKRRGERRGPGQYVKLIYKAMEPNKVSIEFGEMKPVKAGERIRGKDIFEDDF